MFFLGINSKFNNPELLFYILYQLKLEEKITAQIIHCYF